MMKNISLYVLLLITFINCQAMSLVQTEDAKQCRHYFDEAEYQQAFIYCSKAAKQHNLYSLTVLGEIFDSGLAGTMDQAKVEKWWTQAANKNHFEAENLLALKYYYGGTIFEKQEYWKQDYSKAMNLWMKGAKRGVPEAQFMIGVMHQMGQGTEVNLVEAYAWFKLALNGKYKLATDTIMEISKQMSLSDKKEGHQKYLAFLNDFQ